MSDAVARAKERLRYYREADDGAIAFVREQFKAEPDEWQKDALNAYHRGPHRRTVLKACKNPGKTCCEAWCGWHFLSCYPHANVAVTSISGDNLRDGLMKELAKWQLKSPFMTAAFQWTAERIFCKDFPATWWLSARKWSKSADSNVQASTLAGLHSDYMLFILDETGSMPRAVMAAADAALGSGIVTKLLQGGNPERLEGPLYDACTTERHLWNVVDVTGDPDDPKRAPRVSIEWARDTIAKYGRESPWVLINVYGRFPPASLNALLGPEEVEAAMRRHLLSDAYDWAQKRLGIDVSRYGDDPTVIFPRQGLAAFKPVMMMHARNSPVSVNIANRVMMAKTKWKSEMEIFDDTVGWAHGAIDVMRATGHAPIPIAFHAKAPDPRYFNMRAYGWMNMADWVRNGGALPNVPELVAELTIPTYTFHNGKFQIEDKDMVKDRLGRSPNYADALALTFMIPDLPGQFDALVNILGGNQARARTEFDPHRDLNREQARERAATEFDPYRDSI